MQQTLLALGAVLAFSLFALTRHQDDASLERRGVSQQIENAAEGVARARFADVERLAFDEADVGATRLRASPSTIPLGADAAEATPADFDDLDDLDDYEAVAGLPDIRAVPVAQGTVELRVEVATRYVQPSAPDTPSVAPTLAKEVQVRVTEVLPTGLDARRPPVSVTLRRVYTPSGLAAY